MTRTKEDLLAHLNAVTGGLALIRGINETAAPTSEGFALQFDEWDWEIGVGVYGLYRYAAANDDSALIGALVDWYDWQISRGLPARQVNSTAPMLALCCLIDHVDRPEWNALVEDWAEWLCTTLPKTEQGGFQHVTKERQNKGELWDDTLFMTCLFLARAGVKFDRDDWLEEAIYQFHLHARYLSDPVTGLWYHGWTFEGRHNFAKAFWARGNSWATIAIPELFEIVPDMPAASRRFLTSILQSQVTQLRAHQLETGFFRTLITDQTAQIESSATAGIAYGVSRGVALGLLEPEFRQMSDRAFDAVVGSIDEDGIVKFCSDGTPMGHSLQFYKDIPDIPAPYGQALTMLMLVDELGRVGSPSIALSHAAQSSVA